MKNEKYKALKEYIKECETEKRSAFRLTDAELNKCNFSKRIEIITDLNALLKEWFDKQPPDGWVTISKDSVINDKA